MLEKLSCKPNGFDHIPQGENNLSWEVTVEGKHCAYVVVQRIKTYGYIHVEMPKWSAAVGATMIQDFELLKDTLRSNGIKTLIAGNGAHDEKRWTKFITLFGFPKPARYLVSTLTEV